MKRRHVMPFGAECLDESGVRFRLWAPKAQHVGLQLCGEPISAAIPMRRLDDGWFEVTSEYAHTGSQYKFQIDGRICVPDPASRYQPADVQGPSEVVDPREFDWQDANWRGRPWEETVIYELHVGTFTPEGTFSALEHRLDYLAELGVTAVELMPLSDFAGRRNWGYDGVFPFAPDSQYGRPEDLKRLIQSAHAKRLMMFLDVVYNHFGPEGNYLREYAPQFFTDRHCTPWGEGINFDGADSRPVRDFFIHNALYWLTEYHFDGLRLDAVDRIIDDSATHLLTELAETVRGKLDGKRQVHLMLENDSNTSRYLKRGPDGRPKLYTAQWDDDIHHALHAAITGEKDGYYSDHADHPLEHLGRCLAEGFDYQGQASLYRGGKSRGEPSRELPPTAFISFLQNHDQAGNRAFGERIGMLTDPQALRAAAAILLLAPLPPLLFMGEEYGAETPFLFFCDFSGDLAEAVTNGRRREFARFARFADRVTLTEIPDPNSLVTFERSKLQWDSLDKTRHQAWLDFYRDALQVRRTEITPRIVQVQPGKTTFETFGPGGLRTNWKFSGDQELTLVANLGAQPLAITGKPAGRLFYASEDGIAVALESKQMPARSAAWFLKQ